MLIHRSKEMSFAQLRDGINCFSYSCSYNRMRWAGHVARMGEERGRIGSW